MKQLLLTRHAEAEQATHFGKDFDRELNTTGYADASRMGKLLSSKVSDGVPLRVQVVYASPARRTRTTAQLICEQIGFDAEHVVFDPEIYQTSVRKLMLIINGLDEQYDTVMVIGHNPHLTYLAEMLSHAEIGSLLPCGVVCLVFEDQTWAEISASTGKIAWYVHP
jgi:phosphohistidine phosphatase